MPRRTPAEPEKKAWVAYAPTLTWPIDRPKPNPRNARRHTEEQIGRLAEGLQEFGWTYPILVDEREQIIAGHGRLAAARRLGFPEVPVIVAKGWTEAQIAAYTIADNRLAESSTWDNATLGGILAELVGSDYDAELTGFTSKEIGKLLSGDDGPEVVEISTHEVQDRFWISVRGPLISQAKMLDVLRGAAGADPEIEIDVGSISIGD
jgi:ParB-like chromosome segregation protein Spo0J